MPINSVRMALSLLLAAVSLFAIPLKGSASGQIQFEKPLSLLWRHEVEGTLNLTPASNLSGFFLPLDGGRIICLEPSDGALRWKAELGGDVSAAPVAAEGAVFVATQNGEFKKGSVANLTGSLRALGTQSGVTLWNRPLPSPLRGSLSYDGQLIYGGSADGNLYAIRKDTGEIVWAYKNGAAFFSKPIFSGQRLYLGDEAGYLLAFDKLTGTPLWRYQTRGPLRLSIALLDGTIYLGSTDNYVYAINEVDGTLRWRVRTGAGIQSVLPTEKGIVVTSLDNFVYCLSDQKGYKLWKRRMPGRVASQPLANRDSVLLAPLAGDECVILNLDDGKKVNSLLVGEDNNTAASPVLTEKALVITTRQGLLAFGDPSRQSSRMPAFSPPTR